MKPNGLDHSVVVVHNIETARAQYACVFGEHAVTKVLEAEGYQYCVIRLGAQRLELCQPVEVHGDGPAQASLAFRATLESRGEGVHNVAVEVADAEAAHAELWAAGVPLIKSSLSRSFFVHPKALNGVLIQFLEAGQQ
jgi:catechol 2,3-dioxygenase-like lactoylglutathione lyase family enzyme